MRSKRLPLAVQLAVCEQLSQLLSAGFSLRASLQVVTLNFAAQAAVWQAVDQRLSGGSGLAAGLAAVHFHPQIVAALTLAERHGQLALALQDAAALVRVQTESRKKLRQLMMYPLLLLALLAAIQSVLMLGVLPMLGGARSRFVQRELLGGAVLTALGLALWQWLRRLGGARRAHLLLKLPGLRQLATNYYQYQFVSGLAQSLAAGLPLASYVATLATLDASPLAGVGRSIQQQLAAGGELGAALAQPLIFPPARALLLLGQPGPLVQAGMALFARQLLKQFEDRVERWLAVVQPVMFILIGVQIVLMYRELLLPLYDNIGGLP